ncbi:hypothetical protein IscW_ISCW008523 [Ixodes scapularis]|uniref:Uncharacterized protein n=1 Tax=Ixodes scapularis TaxID=6945 RepID=B7PZ09_IXOSC|nr:hypothetical protein IscW_ISCW008523 [Ixodes scapularis]|eukprot:XP_002404353.1 hypothetical protein IscW_ISCW008523 [Ixodes scapularis]
MRARHARGEAKALYVRTSRHSAIETKNASQGGRRFRRSVSSRIEGTPDPARCHAAGSCQKGAFDEEGLPGVRALTKPQTRAPRFARWDPQERPLGRVRLASRGGNGRRARKDQDGDRDLRVALWILGSFGAPDAAEAMAASGRRRSRETRSSTHDRRKRSGNSRDRRKHRSPSREHSGSKSHRRSRSRLQ